MFSWVWGYVWQSVVGNKPGTPPITQTLSMSIVGSETTPYHMTGLECEPRPVPPLSPPLGLPVDKDDLINRGSVDDS